MSQSSYVAFFLITSFIVFIVMRGELRQYLNVLGIDTAASATPNSSSNTSASNLAPALGTALAALPSLA